MKFLVLFLVFMPIIGLCQKTVVKGNVHFQSNESTLVNEATLFLDSIVILHKKGVKINLTGHTDAVGDAESNRKLSERRVAVVADYLLGKGVDTNDIQFSFHGEEIPVAENNSETGKQMNRRVEIAFVYSTNPNTKPRPKPITNEQPKDTALQLPLKPENIDIGDTTIILPNGSAFTVAKQDLLKYGDCIIPVEILTVEQMKLYGINLETSDNIPLVTCGMIGFPSRPACDSIILTRPFKIKVPILCSEYGDNPELFLSTNGGSWRPPTRINGQKRNDLKIQKSGKNIYAVFTIYEPFGLANCDCKVPTRKLGFKAPRGYVIDSVEIISDCPRYYDVIPGKGKVTNRRKVVTELPCMVIKKSYTKVHLSKAGESTIVDIPSILEHKKKSGFYICKSKRRIFNVLFIKFGRTLVLRKRDLEK